MFENTEVTITRDCDAIQIPSGNALIIEAGTPVLITQSLGGSYTVALNQGLARIAEKDADALGIDPSTGSANTEAAPAGGEEATIEQVWDKLKTCFDPEIPVNIVDLGLVYDCQKIQTEDAGTKVEVKMTLTAPGCGMGPAIAADAQSKILSLNGIDEAIVELVWDPPWNQSMISEAGKMQLGMI